MSYLTGLRRRRQPLASILMNEDYQGIRKLVEQLYPDRAHFIYELLQNAEDAGATEAAFELQPDRLIFQHNGRSFEEKDIDAITNIGASRKEEDEEAIGRFGIGFKAVFAYSETPLIYSPTFSFRIDNLVLPCPIKPQKSLGADTRFEFPFNNPKKSAGAAFEEIAQGLQELDSSTLLFLKNLETIRWKGKKAQGGEIQRIAHSLYHVEIITDLDGEAPTSRHYLKFSQPVRELPSQNVALAFELGYLPEFSEYDYRVSLKKQMKIVPAHPAQVFVFFPAEKETSGLQFHVHAPFVPEVSRASVKDTAANEPLFKQLAQLTASSLTQIKKLGFLTPEFLSVLPNDADPLPDRYEGIREAVFEQMRLKALTPTHDRRHAPASSLFQSRALVKDLISPQDLGTLLMRGKETLGWAANITQRNSRIEKFLESLGVEEWDVDQLVELLREHLDEKGHHSSGSGHYVSGPTASIVAWLQGKPAEWLQSLYALLERFYLAQTSWTRQRRATEFASLRLVRLKTGHLVSPGAAFFALPGGPGSTNFPTVDPATYTSGKNMNVQSEAHSFLQTIGVRELDARVQMEDFLKRNYGLSSRSQTLADVPAFLKFVADFPDETSMFRDIPMFKARTPDSKERWVTGSEVLLCRPFLDSGLEQFYRDALGTGRKFQLADDYQSLDKRLSEFLKLCEAAGGQARLEIKATKCHGNPEYGYLVVKAPGNWTENGLDLDYTIEGLEAVLQKPSLETSRVIWKTLLAQGDSKFIHALYRSNRAHELRRAPSKLIASLKKAKWIPQGQTFVQPAHASVDKLPKGFVFDPGLDWIKAIDFGIETRRQQSVGAERQKSAKLLGLPEDEETLEEMRAFAKLPQDKRRSMLAQASHPPSAGFPERESRNPDRRAEKVAKAASDAKAKETEIRERSVAVHHPEAKARARQYLIEQYTKDGQMYCQLCRKPMPFELDDGRPYFEAVEVMPELPSLHPENYLALCPNHAAMYQMVNSSRAALKFLIRNAYGTEIKIVLAKQDHVLRFTKMHLDDLRTVVTQPPTSEVN